MPTLNPALLDKTMSHIENNPDCWDQRSLGVTLGDGRIIADFAGWTVVLAEPAQRPPFGSHDGDCWVPESHWLVHGIWAPAYASQLLGVDVLQGDVFFHSRWGLAALRVGVDALIASEGLIEPQHLQVSMQDAQQRRRLP